MLLQGVLALVALVGGGAIPIFMLLLGNAYAMGRQPADPVSRMKLIHAFMRPYVRFALVPGLVALLAVWVAAAGPYPALANRIEAGLVAGFASALALDVVRLGGVRIGWMPMDMPPMFGLMMLGPEADTRSQVLWGYLYHFLNGIDFGLVYTLVFGRVAWPWGIAWALAVELGMMLSLPVLMPGVRAFGLNKGPGILVVSLLAHLAMGVVLGLVAQALLSSSGSILTLF